MPTQTFARRESSTLPPCSSKVDNPIAAPHSHAEHLEASDEALINRLADGDKSAIRILFRRHNVRVFRFVLRFVANEAMAEEIVGEVFLEVWRDAKAFECRSRFSTWLLANARHKAIAALRHRSDMRLDDKVATAIEEPADGPEVHNEKEDRRAIFRKCLAQLSSTHREIIDLVYYHERSVREIAQILGVPISTVKTRMFYGRNRIAVLLRKAGIDRACL